MTTDMPHIHMSAERYATIRTTCLHFIDKWEDVEKRKGARQDAIDELRHLTMKYEQQKLPEPKWSSVIRGISCQR